VTGLLRCWCCVFDCSDQQVEPWNAFHRRQDWAAGQDAAEAGAGCRCGARSRVTLSSMRIDLRTAETGDQGRPGQRDLRMDFTSAPGARVPTTPPRRTLGGTGYAQDHDTDGDGHRERATGPVTFGPRRQASCTGADGAPCGYLDRGICAAMPAIPRNACLAQRRKNVRTLSSEALALRCDARYADGD
jgi:hypothetical protein